MKMLPHKLRRFLAFNLLNRDLWMAAQAALVSSGSRVLDVGAGSCPYRKLFAHCEYRTQDFQQLADEQLRHGGMAPLTMCVTLPLSQSLIQVLTLLSALK